MTIGCIIILYNKSYEEVKKNIKIIYKDIDNFYIINNSKRSYYSKNKKILIKNLNVNLGIAAAQNLGLIEAYKKKNDYILFSDQDTIFGKNFVKEIFLAFKETEKKNKNIFAISPNLYDRNKQVISGFVQRFFFFRFTIFNNNIANQKKNISEISESMSSGMFLKTQVLKKIGFLNEDLFLDWVDFDLCWRANDKGYKLFGAKDIVANHFLGKKAAIFFKKKYHLHDVYRVYYILRNGIYISLYKFDINFLWKINIFFNTIRYLIGYLIFIRPFFTVCKFSFLGLLHGVSGKLGKLNYD